MGKKKKKQKVLRAQNPGEQAAPATQGKSVLKNTAFQVTILIAVVIAVYANSLGGPFVFDDSANIAENPLIREGRFFLDRSEAEGFALSPQFKKRWVGYLSFHLNYRLHGLEVRGYHIVNLAIHLITVLLIFTFMALSMRAPLMKRSSLSSYGGMVAFIIALLFAVHPVETQAVTYTVQRFASLAAMFCLASAACYAGARLMQRTALRITLLAGTLLFLFLAFKTKENTVTFPFVIVLYEFLFFKTSPKDTRWRTVLMSTIALLPLLFAASYFLDGETDHLLTEVMEQTAVQTIPRGTYLLTELRVISTYLRLLVLPMNQNLDYAYPLSHSLMEPGTLWGACLVAALGTGAVLLYRRSRKGRPALALAAFGIAWHFITLAVESTLVPLFPIFEHRLYLPSIGFFISSVSLAIWSYDRMENARLKSALIALVVLVSLTLGATTLARNAVWQDRITFWKDVSTKAPRNPRALTSLGMAIATRDGTTPEALELFERAVDYAPNYPLARYNLGLAYLVLGRPNDAVTHLTHAVEISKGYMKAHENLGIAYQVLQQLSKAEYHLRRAIELDPTSPTAYNNLGVVIRSQGKWDEAASLFQRAVELEPRYDTAIANLGEALLRLGQPDAGQQALRQAVRINPRNQKALTLLKKGSTPQEY